MEEEIDETVSSLDEKDDEESVEQKEEERIGYPCPPSNESNSSTHTLFNFPSCLPKDDCYDDCYDPVDSFEISLFDKPIRFSFSKTENTAHFRNRYTFLIQIQHLQIVMINPSCLAWIYHRRKEWFC